MANQEKKITLEVDTTKCADFDSTFKQLYNMLNVYGEKTTFHHNIKEQTSPPVEIDLIRRYCNNPSLIPENKRIWWITILTMQLSYEIEKKRANANLFIINSKELIDILEIYLNKAKKESNGRKS